MGGRKGCVEGAGRTNSVACCRTAVGIGENISDRITGSALVDAPQLQKQAPDSQHGAGDFWCCAGKE